jgi:hypothetical protein
MVRRARHSVRSAKAERQGRRDKGLAPAADRGVRVCGQLPDVLAEHRAWVEPLATGGCPQRRELVLPCPLRIEAVRLEAEQLGLELGHVPVWAVCRADLDQAVSRRCRVSRRVTR